MRILQKQGDTSSCICLQSNTVCYIKYAAKTELLQQSYILHQSSCTCATFVHNLCVNTRKASHWTKSSTSLSNYLIAWCRYGTMHRILLLCIVNVISIIPIIPKLQSRQRMWVKSHGKQFKWSWLEVTNSMVLLLKLVVAKIITKLSTLYATRWIERTKQPNNSPSITSPCMNHTKQAHNLPFYFYNTVVLNFYCSSHPFSSQIMLSNPYQILFKQASFLRLRYSITIKWDKIKYLF